MNALVIKIEIPDIGHEIFESRAVFVVVNTLLSTEHVDPPMPLVVISFLLTGCSMVVTIEIAFGDVNLRRVSQRDR